jgi:hypothetical protein
MTEETATGIALRAIRNEIIEECAMALEKAWPPADFPDPTGISVAQDAAIRLAIRAIRGLKESQP